MTMLEAEDWKVKEAKKRVKRRKGFYSHLSAYVIMSTFFILMNLFADPGEFWAIFPMLGWGIGLAFHAVNVFGMPGIGKDWEEKAMEKEMARLEEQDAARKWRAREMDEGYLPPAKTKDDSSFEEDGRESPLELKEMKKEWRDSDFV